MIRSMTGFGEAEVETPEGRIRAEVRSVNHRHLNVRLRTPRGFERHEPRLEGLLRQRLARGHVQCALTLDRRTAEGGEAALELDRPRARAYRRLLEELRLELDLPGTPDLALMARFRELFREPGEEEVAAAVAPETLDSIVEQALDELEARRGEEGERLDADLRERIGVMEGIVSQVEERAPQRVVQERERLREALAELLEGRRVDEDRLEQEVAHLAERWDVNEELVRLRSHFTMFRETLDRSDGEPAGKRLGFIVQELQRETNTLGAKGNDAEMARDVVALKEEVERIKEQLENVE